MKTNYPTKKLGEVCDLVTRGISPKYIESNGVVVLNQKCIRDHKISNQDARWHDNAKTFSDEKFIRVGDVLVNSTGVGTMGRVAQVKSVEQPAVVDSHITIVRPTAGLFDSNYFGWAMIFVEEQIMRMGTGSSGQIELSRTTLKDIEIPLPPLAEQKRIVERIEKQFAKIDEAIRLREQSLAATDALLPATLHEIFEEGKQKGWDRPLLKDICQYSIGLTYSPGDVSDEGYIVLRSSNVQNDQLDFSNIVRVRKEINDNLIVKDGDILMCSRNGSKRLIGKTAMIKNLSQPMTFGAFMTIIRGEYNPYLYWFFKSRNFFDQFESGGGPMINQITKYMLDKILVPLPPLAEQKRIVKKLDTLSAQIRSLRILQTTQLATLKALKQSILHEVFGQ